MMSSLGQLENGEKVVLEDENEEAIGIWFGGRKLRPREA